MTWKDMLRTELSRLYAQERASARTFEALAARAQGERTREILRDAIDAEPGRLCRLEVIFEHADWVDGGDPLNAFLGWLEDVNGLPTAGRADAAGDAAILALLLRMMRMRTSCYEVAHVLASNLGIDNLTALIGALWTEDRETDDHIAGVLADLIEGDEERWDLRKLAM